MTARLEQNAVTSGTAAPELLGSVGKTGAVRVLLFDGDPIRREALTGELSKQGLAFRSFGDAGALLGALRQAVDVDVVVVLLKESGLDLLVELRRQGVTVPVVFLGARPLPAQADIVRKLQGLEGLARRLRSVALGSVDSASEATDQPRHGGPMICGRLDLRPDVRRIYWNGRDVGLTCGEYNIVHMLLSDVGRYRTYRAIYDRLHHQGFIAGSGIDGYRANVRSVIKRIRNKFRAVDLAFDEIETYTGFGYCWRKPAADRHALVSSGRSALAPPRRRRGRA